MNVSIYVIQWQSPRSTWILNKRFVVSCKWREGVGDDTVPICTLSRQYRNGIMKKVFLNTSEYEDSLKILTRIYSFCPFYVTCYVFYMRDIFGQLCPLLNVTDCR